MSRGRAWTRYQARRVQAKRVNKWKALSFDTEWIEIRKGMMKKHNFSCNCPGCRPHKHKLDKKYKPSERRKLGGSGRTGYDF